MTIFCIFLSTYLIKNVFAINSFCFGSLFLLTDMIYFKMSNVAHDITKITNERPFVTSPAFVRNVIHYIKLFACHWFAIPISDKYFLRIGLQSKRKIALNMGFCRIVLTSICAISQKLYFLLSNELDFHIFLGQSYLKY